MAILSRMALRRIGYIIRFRRGLGNVEPGDVDVYCRRAKRTDRLVRPRYFACALLAGLACGAVAEAQTSPGADLIVNPSATGSRVLLYPGGKYSRVVHPLLQPGEPDPNA